MEAILGLDALDPRIEAAARGWGPGAPGPRVAAGVIAKCLNCGITGFQEAGRDLLAFMLDLGSIRLRGMDEVPCLLVGGDSPEIADRIRMLVRSGAATSPVHLLFTPSTAMYDLLTDRVNGLATVVMGREALRRTASGGGLDFLTLRIRTAIPRGSLIPYDILLSATGGMFFGRGDETRRLTDESGTNFAIAGPGRAGKTSLVKNYHLQLRKDNPSRALATHFIDLMECTQRHADGYAQFITARISPRDAGKISADQIVGMLREQAAHLKQSVNLLLDETDDMCLDARILTPLAVAARDGSARLVFCGKGDLFRTMLDERSHIAKRLELIRIGPLEEHPARKLLIEPLAALGISFPDLVIVDEIMRLTGRLPHLIQLYALHLAELSMQTHQDKINREALETLRSDNELGEYFVSPVQDMRDPAARLVALHILRDHERDVWKPVDIAGRIEGLGLQRARDLLNELVISNVLVWHRDSFRLANQALRVYAEHLGIIDDEYDEALREYRARRKGSVEQ